MKCIAQPMVPWMRTVIGPFALTAPPPVLRVPKAKALPSECYVFLIRSAGVCGLRCNGSGSTGSVQAVTASAQNSVGGTTFLPSRYHMRSSRAHGKVPRRTGHCPPGFTMGFTSIVEHRARLCERHVRGWVVDGPGPQPRGSPLARSFSILSLRVGGYDSPPSSAFLYNRWDDGI